jgi:hypothetical protein
MNIVATEKYVDHLKAYLSKTPKNDKDKNSQAAELLEREHHFSCYCFGVC